MVAKNRKHHVILMRHCFRSTQEKVWLYNETGKATYSYDPQDFIAAPLPNWNVPEMHCLPHGIKIIKETAKFIFQKIVPSESKEKKVKIQIVTDSSPRDVDTSFAFYEGFMEASKGSHHIIEGLPDLQYDHALFHPVKAGLCENNYPTERLASDIQHRFQNVKPPESDLSNVLSMIQKLGGIGKSGPLTSMDPTLRLSPHQNYTKFEGPMNIVKLFSQMAFFSRAAEIDPPFLPNATLSEVYNLLEWVYWSRSVLSIDNVKSATMGAVLVQKLIEALETGFHYIPTSQRLSKDEDTDDIRIIIYAGHDTNLDECATTLGKLVQLFVYF